MPAVYQPQPQQQIPAQYDVVDVLPRPQPQEPPKPPKKKKTPKWLWIILIILCIILLPFIAIVVWAIFDVSKNPPVVPTYTPTPTYTETFTVTPTNTLIPSDTPVPTNTPEPTITPTPLPAGWEMYTVVEGDNCWAIADSHGVDLGELLRVNGMGDRCNINIGDQIVIPAAVAAALEPVTQYVPQSVPDQTYSGSSNIQSNTGTGVGGSVTQNVSSACVIKGSESGIYHCKNSPNYNTMKNYRCFGSQAEAEAAGYRMSGNQHGWCQE